jgi:phosphate starvation-inducible PhoH-like protein
MVLTRLGKDSKLIITGDTGQHDRGFDNNGLLDLVTRLAKSPIPGIEVVQFTESDIRRHDLIKEILRLYGP